VFFGFDVFSMKSTRLKLPRTTPIGESISGRQRLPSKRIATSRWNSKHSWKRHRPQLPATLFTPVPFRDHHGPELRDTRATDGETSYDYYYAPLKRRIRWDVGNYVIAAAKVVGLGEETWALVDEIDPVIRRDVEPVWPSKAFPRSDPRAKGSMMVRQVRRQLNREKTVYEKDTPVVVQEEEVKEVKRTRRKMVVFEEPAVEPTPIPSVIVKPPVESSTPAPIKKIKAPELIPVNTQPCRLCQDKDRRNRTKTKVCPHRPRLLTSAYEGAGVQQ